MTASTLHVAHGGVPAGKEEIYGRDPILSARKLVITFGRVVGLAGVDQQWRVLATGVLVIVAVAIDQWIRKVKA